ncbi:DUF6470 family protein [Paenibacillus sp. FSL P2-0136]|uniref:DUF6470 family protein n=1 Tax=unclassified Paenibacillus TaxID=185978 RepID=UPI0030DC417D
MVLSVVQIRQTPGLIGIDSDMGEFSIIQHQAELNITSERGQWDIQQFKPEMSVDQSKALAAYNGGSLIEVNRRIYSGIEQIYLQGIARRVEQGNRMAEFFKPGNSIAELYGGDWNSFSFPEIRGPASYDNVDIHFETRSPRIEFLRGAIKIDVVVRRPDIEYKRGKLDIYMRQYTSIQFIPPEVNLQW